MLIWLVGAGCPINRKFASYAAAQSGHVHVLRWLHTHGGADWDHGVCALAAAHGHLEALQYVRLQGCDWGEDTCLFAAENGHVEVLQWARAQAPPCPWSSSACLRAAVHNQLPALQWLRAQSPPCPWERAVILRFLGCAKERTATEAWLRACQDWSAATGASD